MPDVTVNGCRIWYELKGSGDYLLQIGGAGVAHTNLMEAPELSVKVVTEFLQRVSTGSGVGVR